MKTNRFYLGVKGRVVCFDRETGRRVWETHLKRGMFVNVFLDEDSVLAHTSGELFCLDPESGSIRWQDGLSGLGYGLATFASATGDSSQQLLSVIQEHQNQQAAASSAGTTGAAGGS